MATSVVQVTLALSAALLLVRLLQRRPPRIRQAVLIVALVKCLCPPGWLPLPGVLAGGVDALAGAGGDLIAAARGASWLMQAQAVLQVLYFVGLAAVLVVVAREFVRTRRIVALAKPAEPAWQDRLRRLELGDRRRRDVQLWLSGACTAPLAVGLFRRRIVLPAELIGRLPESDLDLILRHELAHHAGRHLAVAWLRTAACAVWWWHPLVWIASASLRHAQEEQCDDDAVERGGVDGERYAEALVLAAAPGREPAFTLGMAGQGHPLEARVRRLLGPRPSRRGLWLAWIVGAAMAIATLPGGQHEPRWQRSPASPRAIVHDILYAELTAAGAPTQVAARVAERAAARAAGRR